MPYSGRKVNCVPLKAYSLPEQRRQRNCWTSGRSILIMLSTVTVVSLRLNSFYNNDVARLKVIVWVISTNERVLSLIILGWRLEKEVKFSDTLNNFCVISFLRYAMAKNISKGDGQKVWPGYQECNKAAIHVPCTGSTNEYISGIRTLHLSGRFWVGTKASG